jgi:glucose-6-phosphate isomerase
MSKVNIDINFSMSKYLNGGIENIDEYKSKAQKGLSQLIKSSEENKVGFTKLVNNDYKNIKDFAKSVAGKFNDLIVIGIGGSSLGFEAIVDAILPYGHNSLSFSERGGFPRIWIADNIDPYKSYWITKNCVPQDTNVCVITKSGSTVETISNFMYIYNWLEAEVEDIKEHIVVITDNVENSLRKFAIEKHFQIFDIPINVGGRYSVLSPVGMVPASMLGMDINKFLQGAKDAVETNYEKILHLAAVYIYYIEKRYNINVIMPYSSRLNAFGKWFCQLWAESLGKKYNLKGEIVNFGTTPLPSIGANDQHSLMQLFKEGPNDKIITFIEVENHDFEIALENIQIKDFDYLKDKKIGNLINIELKSTELALEKENKASIKIIIENIDEYTLGYLFMLYQYVVPVIGYTFDINPFDQPGVEEGKKFAYALMGRAGYEDKKKEFEEMYIKENDYIL